MLWCSRSDGYCAVIVSISIGKWAVGYRIVAVSTLSMPMPMPMPMVVPAIDIIVPFRSGLSSRFEKWFVSVHTVVIVCIDMH